MVVTYDWLRATQGRPYRGQVEGTHRDGLGVREKKAELVIKLADVVKMVGLPRTTNHDMRRTARNIWEAMDVPFHVAETMLGHKVHRGVQSHYLDYDYLDEQREAYASWCSELTDSKTKRGI